MKTPTDDETVVEIDGGCGCRSCRALVISQIAAMMEANAGNDGADDPLFLLIYAAAKHLASDHITAESAAEFFAKAYRRCVQDMARHETHH